MHATQGEIALICALSRWSNVHRWKAFNAWRDWLAEINQQWMIVRSVLAHLASQWLSRAWKLWRRGSRYSLLDSWHHVLGHWMGHTLSRGWNTWRDWALNRLHSKGMMLWGCAHLTNRGLALSFNRWADVSLSLCREQTMLNAGLSKWKQQQLSRPWNQWRDFRLELAIQRTQAARVVERLLQRSMSSAWNKWTWMAGVHKDLKLKDQLLAAQHRIKLLRHSGLLMLLFKPIQYVNPIKLSMFSSWQSHTRRALSERCVFESE